MAPGWVELLLRKPERPEEPCRGGPGAAAEESGGGAEARVGRSQWVRGREEWVRSERRERGLLSTKTLAFWRRHTHSGH